MPSFTACSLGLWQKNNYSNRQEGLDRQEGPEVVPPVPPILPIPPKSRSRDLGRPIPAVRPQCVEKPPRQPCGVARRDVPLDVSRLAHARERCAHRGMMQDEPEGQFR